MADMTAAVVLLLKDKLSPAMKKIVSGFKQLKTAADQVNRSGRGYGLAKQFTDAEVKARKLRLEVSRLHRTMGDVKKNAGSLFARGGVLLGGIAAAKGAMLALAAPMVSTAADFEKYQLMIKNATTSPAEAKAAMAWIMDFEGKTPFNLDEVTRGYISLRQMGIDPMKGALLAAGDAAAASGKDMLAAVEAIKDAATGENERLKEFGITSSVNSKKGKVSYSYATRDGTMKTVTADLKDQMQIVATLSGIWKEKFGGSMDDLSKGWGGIMSSLDSFKTKIELLVMNGGPFERLKTMAQDFLTQLQVWEKDGTLKRFADAFATNINATIDRLVPLATGAWNALRDVLAVIDQIATAAGGYQNLGYFAAGLFLVGSSLSLIKSLAEAAVILGKISALTAGGTAVGLLGIAGGLAAIAGSLFLLEQYKPEILDQLEALRPGDPAARQPLPEPKPQMMVGQDIAVRAGQITNEWLRAEYAKLDAAWQAWSSGMRAKAAALGQQITSAIVSGLGSLFSAGAQLVASLWEGMKSKFGELLASVSSWGSQIKAAVMNGTTVTPAPFRGGRFAPAPSTPAAGSPGHDGARAMGGSIYKGGTYLTGERGPELITAGRYGAVTPLGKGRGGTTVHVTMGGITINGNADRGAIAELADRVAARIRQGLHDGAYA